MSIYFTIMIYAWRQRATAFSIMVKLLPRWIILHGIVENQLFCSGLSYRISSIMVILVYCIITHFHIANNDYMIPITQNIDLFIVTHFIDAISYHVCFELIQFFLLINSNFTLMVTLSLDINRVDYLCQLIEISKTIR